MSDEPDLSKFKMNEDGQTISFTPDQFGLLLSLIGACATLSINSAAMARAAGNPEQADLVAKLSEDIKRTGTRVVEHLEKLTGQKIDDL